MGKLIKFSPPVGDHEGELTEKEKLACEIAENLRKTLSKKQIDQMREELEAEDDEQPH